MHDDLLLGIDIGTSSVRACIFSPEGKLVGSGRVPYRVDHPCPGWAEVGSEVWWQAFLSALAEAFENGRIPAGAIRSAGISTLFPTMIPFDAEGNPLAPAILYCDQRSTTQVESARHSGLAATLEKRTSNRVVPGTFSLMSLLWLRDERPAVYESATCFGTVNTLFSLRLAGVPCADYTTGLFSGLCEASDATTWSRELAGLAGVDASKLPPLCAPGAQIGRVTRKAAGITGLVEGTPVAAGAGDVAAASLGGGCIAPGNILYTSGSSDCLSLVLGSPPTSPLLANMGYLDKSTWLSVGTSTSAGAALDWFAQSLLGEGSGAAVAVEAAASTPGAGGVVFLPYLQGERTPLWDAHARGAFSGLTLTTSRADLARAVLEGTAFALRHILETMEKEAGIAVHELPAAGGGARNEIWNRIKADVTGRRLRVFEFQEFSALGAAMLAGLASGVYRSAQDAVATTAEVRKTKIIEPDMKTHEAYEESYRQYVSLYPAIKGSR